ncbi:MAG TPA: methyltransferase [Haliangiales bacterium]|nr:methyltransferase [Haliangiales bacterium]
MPSPREICRALTELAATGRDLFERTCTPGRAEDGVPAASLPGDVLATLLAARIVEEEDGVVYPRLWVALRRDRPYLMSFQSTDVEDASEQDVWPESDALLLRLDAAPPGTLLDMGCGSGVIAVEAALRGHRVTATDLYQEALELTRWNAEMHGVDVELLAGHLFEPVAGRTFDLILTAPHYAPPNDLLRVEALRAGPAAIAPGGAMVVATYLEWGPGEQPGIVASVLAPLAEGCAVDVRPIRAASKRRWHTQPVPHAPHLVGRHRFLVEIRPGASGLRFERPADDDVERETVVPLARLVGANARRAEVRAGLDEANSGTWDRNVLAEIAGENDVRALERLLQAMAKGSFVLDAPIPFRLLDACRFGEKPCLSAHGAIVDAAGGVRPCVRGAAVGRTTDRDADMQARMRELADELAARRGCAECPARKVCSRCAFPFVVDEARYCDLVRAHAPALPRLHKLLHILTQRWPDAVRAGELRVKVFPGAPLMAARFRPEAPEAQPDEQLRAVPEQFRAWGGFFVVVPGERAAIEIEQRAWYYTLSIRPDLADVAELAIDGMPRAALYAYAAHRRIGPTRVDLLVAQMYVWLQSLA